MQLAQHCISSLLCLLPWPVEHLWWGICANVAGAAWFIVVVVITPLTVGIQGACRDVGSMVQLIAPAYCRCLLGYVWGFMVGQAPGSIRDACGDAVIVGVWDACRDTGGAV